MRKKIVYGIFISIVLLSIWQYQLIGYGFMQAKGQLTIIFKSRPVDKVLLDPNVADSLKQKLIYIQEVRQFAIDSLGINDSDNYTTLYDQQGKPILWVVTACEPFALIPKTWKFPLIGSFPYKGFFVEEKAIQEAEKLRNQGFDARVGTVSGWSTLGWLKDPILSNMLFRGDGSLAELIIHELTHATVYVKDSAEFNENLATFIGEKGAERFLAYKFGPNSIEFNSYKNRRKDDHVYTKYILQSAQNLDSLYRKMPFYLPRAQKQALKNQYIHQIMEGFFQLPLADSLRTREWITKNKPDNTFFMSYIRYNAKQNTLEEVFQQQFNGNFEDFLNYFKEHFPSL